MINTSTLLYYELDLIALFSVRTGECDGHAPPCSVHVPVQIAWLGRRQDCGLFVCTPVVCMSVRLEGN